MRLKCIRCGKLSSMDLEDMQNGETEPLDFCKDCMTFSSFHPITKKIILDLPEESNNHPWSEFLRVRLKAIQWFHEKNYSDQYIASSLSMDEEQVHSIRMNTLNHEEKNVGNELG